MKSNGALNKIITAFGIFLLGEDVQQVNLNVGLYKPSSSSLEDWYFTEELQTLAVSLSWSAASRQPNFLICIKSSSLVW